MANGITINLLPQSFEINKRQVARKNLVIKTSVLLLAVTVAITAGVLAFSIEQSFQLRSKQDDLNQTEAQLSEYKDQAGILYILKNRLDTITSVSSSTSTVSKSFSLISSLLPQDMQMVNFNIDQTSKLTLETQTTDLNSLNTFLNNILDPNQTQGKISSPHIDGLSEGQDGSLRLDLSMNLTKH